MAPHSSKSSKEKYDPLSPNGIKKFIPKSPVRTELVVNNIYAYLLRESDGNLISDMPTVNATEIKVQEALKNVVDDFRTCYSEAMSKLSSSFDVDYQNLRQLFFGVANELFSQGITWAKVAVLFVFAAELATKCQQRNLPDSLVQSILDCLFQYVKENLEKWIFDHGGWEGIIEFSSEKNVQEGSTLAANKSSGWAKCVLHGTVRMLGTLAQIANSTGPAMSFSSGNY